MQNIFAIETGGQIGHLGLEKSKWGYTIQNTRFLGVFVVNDVNGLLTVLWQVQMRVRMARGVHISTWPH